MEFEEIERGVPSSSQLLGTAAVVERSVVLPAATRNGGLPLPRALAEEGSVAGQVYATPLQESAGKLPGSTTTTAPTSSARAAGVPSKAAGGEHLASAVVASLAGLAQPGMETKTTTTTEEDDGKDGRTTRVSQEFVLRKVLCRSLLRRKVNVVCFSVDLGMCLRSAGI